jgi:hypothetical protein
MGGFLSIANPISKTASMETPWRMAVDDFREPPSIVAPKEAKRANAAAT